MAYTRPYGSGGFKDSPDTSTAVTAAALNTMDVGIANAHTDIANTLATIPSRNRIINGAMMVDQRYAGASRSASSGDYNADRFYTVFNTGTVTSQRVSNDGPAGVSPYSIKLTFASAGSFGTAGNYSVMQQKIEGYNVADLGFGTASPQSLVLSFYVKCSVTGTFSVALGNGAANRSYVSTYTVNAANTWERKSVTLTADASGTWAVDNTTGLTVEWSFGQGSTYTTSSANQWVAGWFQHLSSASHIATNAGATWQISGVQLEYGTAATRFEHRSFDEELRRCQRYYEKSYDYATVPASNTTAGSVWHEGGTHGDGTQSVTCWMKVPKRAQNYQVSTWATDTTAGQWNYTRSGASGKMTMNVNWQGETCFNVYGNTGANWVVAYSYGHWAASSEL